MTIGQRIAALRKQAGLSQEALAAQLNVSRRPLASGRRMPSLPGLDNLQELARALGVSCDELLTGEKRPSAADQPSRSPGPRPRWRAFRRCSPRVNSAARPARDAAIGARWPPALCWPPRPCCC